MGIDFWRRSDVRIKDIREDRTKRSTVESNKRSASTFFSFCRPRRGAEDTGVPAKGLTGQAYEGHYFGTPRSYLLPFLTYTSPQIAGAISWPFATRCCRRHERAPGN